MVYCIHPVLFAAVAVIAVGFVIYEYVQYKNKYTKISKSNFFMITIFFLHGTCSESKNDEKMQQKYKPSSPPCLLTPSTTPIKHDQGKSHLDTKNYDKNVLDGVVQKLNKSHQSDELKTHTGGIKSGRRKKHSQSSHSKSSTNSQHARSSNLETDSNSNLRHYKTEDSESRDSESTIKSSNSSERSRNFNSSKKSSKLPTPSCTDSSNDSFSSSDSCQMYKQKVYNYLKNIDDLETMSDSANGDYRVNFLNSRSTAPSVCKAWEENMFYCIHPVHFAIVAVIAVDIIYEYVQYKKNDEQMQHKYKPSPPCLLTPPTTPIKHDQGKSQKCYEKSNDTSCYAQRHTESDDSSTVNYLRKRNSVIHTDPELKSSKSSERSRNFNSSKKKRVNTPKSRTRIFS